MSADRAADAWQAYLDACRAAGAAYYDEAEAAAWRTLRRNLAQAEAPAAGARDELRGAPARFVQRLERALRR